MNKNLGVLVRPRQPTDYIFGGSPIVYQVVNPTGNWPRPIGETQHDNVVDWMDCVSESMAHCIESQILFLTGQKLKLSARFIAKMSGTTPDGNYQTVVADAVKKYGVCLEQDWPRPSDPNATWNDYYADIPQAVKDKALDFLKAWSFNYEFVNEPDVPKALKQAPLQVIILKESPYHALEMPQAGIEFDTYEPYEKPLQSVYDYLKPLITPKMNSYVETMNYNGTVGIFVPLDSEDPKEIGLFNNLFNINITPDSNGVIATQKTVVDK